MLEKIRVKKTQCILLGGSMGSGKSTLANSMMETLSESGYSADVFAFATPIKWIARAHFKWDGEKDARGRRLLQVIGTDAGRAYYEDIWVDTLLDLVEQQHDYPYDFIIVDDWRYKNEYYRIKEHLLYDVHRVVVKRDDSLKDSKYLVETSHQSENSLPQPTTTHESSLLDDLREYPGSFYDFAVNNVFTPNSLRLAGDKILELIIGDLKNGISN